MRFRVRHLTRYRYDAPVALGPHVLRLTPRAGTGLTHDLRVSPEPWSRTDETDAHGNRITRVAFDGETRELTIDSRFTLDTRGALAPLSAASDRYLQPGPADPAVAAFADRLRAEAGPDLAAFAKRLTTTLFETIDHDIRDAGAARPPGETLALGHGACRDIAVLFVDTCRIAGLPARFVSGYQATSSRPTPRRYLHAWPEVLLPGRGWQGYDPTRGIAVSETHVALAAAPDQAGTMPVEGSYFGAPVGSSLEFDLEIEARA